jgi:hypothetical protein
LKKNLVFSEEPNSWQDLQEKVKVYFNEIGFTAETEIVCEGARFKFEADVLAVNNDIIKQKILIECKYWKSSINQDVVFSLKSRMDDIGATNGIIVSKNGFQNGALQSINNSSIELYTFDSLIDRFEPAWTSKVLQQFYNETIYFDSNEIEYLFECDGRICSDEFGFYSEKQRIEFRKIMEKYGYINFVRANMRSGLCRTKNNYSDEYFICLANENSDKCLGEFLRNFYSRNEIAHFKNEIQQFMLKSKQREY